MHHTAEEFHKSNLSIGLDCKPWNAVTSNPIPDFLPCLFDVVTVLKYPTTHKPCMPDLISNLYFFLFMSLSFQLLSQESYHSQCTTVLHHIDGHIQSAYLPISIAITQHPLFPLYLYLGLISHTPLHLNPSPSQPLHLKPPSPALLPDVKVGK